MDKREKAKPPWFKRIKLHCDDCHEDYAVQVASAIVCERLVILKRHAFAASVLLVH